ncbi:uncharacterized protein F5Z01DRAFT_620858 [Emericellopsis atlantica]|uniref:Uncharacterized protein n=1 Tax=Emericellopsis atlantica TaxID=2614577 RepID=A0A9P7ZNB1_9HYPO|nr:uncharacterized protein F5Z01DRAFT_620858 [Emericellopsis atlantica]KAG9255086.1 hypothetical protein F5Z01DRAFT_620858 [Emericellopsis atlantica]
MLLLNNFCFALLLHFGFFFGTVLSDRWYYDDDCDGRYIAFDANDYRKCYTIPKNGGYAKSIQSDSSGLPEQWVAYRRRQGGAQCGYSVCSFNNLNSRCCTARSKSITGLEKFRIDSLMSKHQDTQVTQAEDSWEDIFRVGRSREQISQAVAARQARGGAGTQDEGGACEQISWANAEIFIDLPDGTHHGLGRGTPNVTEGELQRQLKAAGKPELSEEKIAQLREDKIVVGEANGPVGSSESQ